jgi:hypothetical protein
MWASWVQAQWCVEQDTACFNACQENVSYPEGHLQHVGAMSLLELLEGALTSC